MFAEAMPSERENAEEQCDEQSSGSGSDSHLHRGIVKELAMDHQ